MIKISKPADVTHTSYANAVVYGEAGIGKTVLCATAPSPLILSAEAGLLSIADKDVDVVEINSLSDMKQAYEFLKKSDHKYLTANIDSLSEVAQTVLAEYKAVEKDPRQAYGKMAEEIIQIIGKYKALPMNVVFVAKLDRITDELTGRTMYGPLFPGRILKAEVPYQVDIVMPMRFKRKDGKSFRILQTTADIQYIAKDRTGKLADTEEPDLTKLFTKAIGESNASNN